MFEKKNRKSRARAKYKVGSVTLSGVSLGIYRIGNRETEGQLGDGVMRLRSKRCDGIGDQSDGFVYIYMSFASKRRETKGISF